MKPKLLANHKAIMTLPTEDLLPDQPTSKTLSGNLTPMMQQYMGFRTQLPAGTLLFFRLGDFFELFLEDAEIGSKIMGLTLTKRHETPMAGIPAYTLDNYVQKCLEAGYCVAICDQVEAPQAGKLVRRALTRILTPGTTLEASGLEGKENNLLLAFHLYQSKPGITCAWADIASGHFTIAYAEDAAALIDTLYALPIRELLIPEGARAKWEAAQPGLFKALAPLFERLPVAELPLGRFDLTEGARHVRTTLDMMTLAGFGIKDTHPALGSAGALLHYATQSLCQAPTHLRKLSEHAPAATLRIDPSTLRGLEVFRSTTGEREGSLLKALNGTVTAAGSRLLERTLASPLVDLIEITRRQQIVGAFVRHPALAEHLQTTLSPIRDIPRILSRLSNRARNPRELGGIRSSLLGLPAILKPLETLAHTEPHLAPYLTKIDRFEDLTSLLEHSLYGTLPTAIGEGPVIATGIDLELDRLQALGQENDSWLLAFEQEEQKVTGIKNLKVRYHGTLGYCIEVTKANLGLVPAHYIRRQTGANNERYTTPALREKERAVFTAKDAAFARETILFEGLVAAVLALSERLYEAAEALAELDLFIGWGTLAHAWNYCCPTVDNSQTLTIEEGRHPIVEQLLQKSRLGLAGSTSFVPNGLTLGETEAHVAVITGPNMAGKSTFIRQTALIALMAQLGAWVPAKACHIGLVDRLFARIGASDELGKGHSTFMVEMSETAHLVHHSTARSLILLDEVGRGTSTYDGLSLAWALLEHLHTAGTRTLFATHYHELTQLEGILPSLKNLCMLVHEEGGSVNFLRRVVPGAANRSYGIHVAKLAGLPPALIARAEVVLKELEAEGRILIDLLEKAPAGKTKTTTPRLILPSATPQLNLFE